MTRRALILPIVLCLAAGAAHGQAAPEAAPARKLVVGTKVAPPFATKDAEGAWHGISIDLWREIAAELKWDFEFRELDLQALLAAVGDGEVDVAVAALTVTAEREAAMDFTHPLHTAGLSIAVRPGRRASWLMALRQLLSLNFLKAVGTLALVLFAAGTLVWLFERKRNAAQFGGTAAKGLGAGFWWSAVTMTTVGYGDKAPVTLAGRLVALVWMFAAVIIIAAFTGAIASALTVGQLESGIQGPDDLPSVRVGTIAGSTSETYLRGRRIVYQTFDSIEAGMGAVAAGTLDAFVYDAPLLRFLANSTFKGAVDVLPVKFERQDYSFALPTGSPLREPINRILLRKITQPEWQNTLYRYLGD